MKLSELLIIGAIFAVSTFVGVFLATSAKTPTLGGTSSLASYPCATVTNTRVAIGNQLSTTVLAASSRRAWARISVPNAATSTFFLSLGGTATVGSGVVLNGSNVKGGASSTPFIDIGLDTWLPYTGAVSAITNVGSTTAVVSTCAY